jgi:hypothetical protein
MTIPYYLEQLIHTGQAEAKVYTGGLSAQSEILCPPGCYLVVYGYHYKPYNPVFGDLFDSVGAVYPAVDFRDAVQFVSFGYNGKFCNFVHSVNLNPDVSGQIFLSSNPGAAAQQRRSFSDIEVQSRSCYLVSNTNVGISISRLTAGDVNINATGTLPNNESILGNLGYGNLVSELSFDQYITNAPLNDFFPLTTGTTEDIITIAPGRNYTNQLYTNPSAGGALEDPTLYTALQESAGKAKMPVINVLYVQVNEQKPQNLI